jgi:hypothetical protein
MKLTFHIFRKDVRYLWREIAVSLAFLIACAWSIPYQWADLGTYFTSATGPSALASSGGFWAHLLVVLLPVSWLFMIVRAIQCDSLVGDRQFWITRPYDGRQLLAAKCLFVLAFVNLPLLILDLYLLVRAGFTPTHHLVGLLRMQLSLTLILVIPIAALATVTTTVVQLLLASLVIILYLAGASFQSWHYPLPFPASEFADPGLLSRILLIATPLAIIGLQYARRRTTFARSLILVPNLGLALITLLAPNQTLIDRQYPALKAGDEPPIQFLSGKNLGTWTAFKEFGITLPLQISRTDPDSFLVLKGSHVVVDGRNGVHWDAGWTSMNEMRFLPGQNLTNVSFALPKNLYQQFRESEVKLRVTVAFTYFRDANSRAFVVPSGAFTLPEGGRCSAWPNDSQKTYGRQHLLLCLAPLHRPKSLHLRLKLSESTCPLPEGSSTISDDATGALWIQSADSPAELGINPVEPFEIMLSTYTNLYHPHDKGRNDPRDDDPQNKDWDASLRAQSLTYRLYGICPGTPITLSDPEFVRDMQIGQEFDAVRLP